MRGSRAREGIFIACLVVLALVLSSAVGAFTENGLGLGAQLVRSAQSIETRVNEAETAAKPTRGTLLVKTTLSVNGAAPTALSGVNVTVNGPDANLSPPYLTNATGEVELSVATGAYLVTVADDPLFRTPIAQAQVYRNQTTEMDVAADKWVYQAVSGELMDEGSTGFIGPWQDINLTLESGARGTPIPQSGKSNGSVFIAASYDNNLSSTARFGAVVSHLAQGGDLVETPAVVVSSIAQGKGVVSLSMRPSSFIPLTGLVSIAVSTYSVSERLSTR